MTDWNPQVVVIEKVEKHPDADALDVATVLGDYPVIIKRGEYKVGDLAGYIPIDTIVPDMVDFYFLCPKAYEKYEDENGQIQQRMLGPKYQVGSVPEKYRIIKAKKIRGRYSQGMLVNHLHFWETMYDPLPSETGNFQVGESIVELIGLKKWEELEEDNIPNAKKGKGANQASPPKGWSIPFYDIEGLRKYVDCLLPDEEIVLTEKVHGSNAAFCHDGEQLWVKSRNYYKKMDSDDPWWDIAIRYGLEEKLKNFPNMVFFGEMYGQVKGFRYDCVIENGAMHSKIRFFDVWDVKAMRYLDYDPFVAMVEAAGLDLMPELYRGVWQGKELMYPYAEGMTTLGGKHIREGFVLRTIKERYEPRLDSRMHIKLVGEAYNLQK